MISEPPRINLRYYFWEGFYTLNVIKKKDGGINVALVRNAVCNVQIQTQKVNSRLKIFDASDSENFFLLDVFDDTAVKAICGGIYVK